MATRELRIAVVMSGGVSLAIWIGGVAAELLRLVEKPEDYGIDTKNYTPRIDVIAGTSAGGLNGVLLAAALAWGIDSDRFVKDVRETWINMGAIDGLLRDPLKADPPSLLNGDGVFEPALFDLLSRWRANSKTSPLGINDLYGARPDDLRLAITTTLLNPNPGGYHDSLGTRIVEPKHTVEMTFTGRHFRDEAAGLPKRLAAAARATSAFPAAFEPKYLSGEGDASLGEHVGFKLDGKWAMDGGVLVNRPLGMALHHVDKQPATGPMKRIVTYIVPDPDPSQSTTDDPSVEVAKEDRDEHDAIPSISLVLAKTIEATKSQSLAEDLEHWRNRNLLAAQQRDLRLSLSHLELKNRWEVAEKFYPQFLEQRATVSATQTVRHLLERPRPVDDPTNWAELHAALVDGRRLADWRLREIPGPKDQRESFETAVFPSAPMTEDSLWIWGLKTLVYMAETMSWLMLATNTTSPDVRHKSLEQVRQVRSAMECYYELSTTFWTWEIEARYPRTSSPGQLRQEQSKWARRAYNDWPQVMLCDGLKNDLVTRFQEITQSVEETVTELRRLSRSIDNNFDSSQLLQVTNGEAKSLDQDDYRAHLTWLAKQLAAAYGVWVATVPAPPDRSKPGGTPLPPVTEQEKNGREQEQMQRLARDLCPPADDGEPTLMTPIFRMIPIWVIQVVTNEEVVTGEPVDLIQISADNATSPIHPSFRVAKEKLAGVQLAHFGAFYKRSWRANDWMWGRLDGSQSIEALINHLENGRQEEESPDPVGPILRTELQAVRVQIDRSEADGGKLSNDAETFRQAFDSATESGGRVPLPRQVLTSLLGQCRVGQERVISEVGTDQFTVSATKAMAISATALHGKHGGFGALRHVFGQIRNLGVLPFYFLAHTIRGQSKTNFALALSSLIVTAGIVVLDLGLGVDFPNLLTGLALAGFAFWVLYSVLAAGRGRALLGGLAGLVLLLISLSLIVVWETNRPLASPVTLECTETPIVVSVGEDTYRLSEDCSVELDTEATDAQTKAAIAERVDWVRVGWALAAAFVSVATLAAAIRGRPVRDSSGLAVALAVGALATWWPGLVVWWAIPLVLVAVGLQQIVADFIRRRSTGGLRPEDSPKPRRYALTGLGLLATPFLVGSVAAGRHSIERFDDPSVLVAGTAPWIAESRLWLILGLLGLPIIAVLGSRLIQGATSLPKATLGSMSESINPEEELRARLASDLPKCDATYLSVPITSGPRLIELARELGGIDKVNEDPKLKRSRVQDLNEQEARIHAAELEACGHDYVINPAEFTRPGWDQGEYLEFWHEIIGTYAKRVVAAPGWALSHGARDEVRAALAHPDKDVYELVHPVGKDNLIKLTDSGYSVALSKAWLHLGSRGFSVAEIDAYLST